LSSLGIDNLLLTPLTPHNLVGKFPEVVVERGLAVAPQTHLAVYFYPIDLHRPAQHALLLPPHALHDAPPMVPMSALQFQRDPHFQAHAAHLLQLLGLLAAVDPVVVDGTFDWGLSVFVHVPPAFRTRCVKSVLLSDEVVFFKTPAVAVDGHNQQGHSPDNRKDDDQNCNLLRISAIDDLLATIDRLPTLLIAHRLIAAHLRALTPLTIVPLAVDRADHGLAVGSPGGALFPCAVDESEGAAVVAAVEVEHAVGVLKGD
jgi:hypothetical protein